MQSVVTIKALFRLSALIIVLLLVMVGQSASADNEDQQRGLLTSQCPAQSLCEQASISALLDKINEQRNSGPGCFSQSFFHRWYISRRYKGTHSLSFDKRLNEAASMHASDMADNSFLGHSSSEGVSYQSRVSQTGYQWVNVAENIAAGQMTIDKTFQAWLDSKQHCDLMLSADYQEAGLACAINCNDPYGVYWALVLASPK